VLCCAVDAEQRHFNSDARVAAACQVKRFTHVTFVVSHDYAENYLDSVQLLKIFSC
jgi:hypothetical protein